MQLIGVGNPAPSVCSANISGCSPSVRMTITLPFGLTTQSMSGGCIPCSRHCLSASRSSSSIFLCSQEKPAPRVPQPSWGPNLNEFEGLGTSDYRLSLSRSHFFDERQRQLSCGSHNCRFVKATEQARSCVMDLIFPGEFTRAGAREHDGALRRFEYRRHLMFAGTELDLKGAFWEWSIYSHRDDLLERRGPSFPA
jgi:hypothetical protein